MIKNEKKEKSICIRVSDSDYSKLNLLSAQNNNTLSAYILNQALHPTSTIYTKEFFDTVLKLSSFINNFKATDSTSIMKLELLRTEVQHLWQYLK